MLEHSSRLGVDPQPVGPLGLIAMDGCKPLGEKVNEYLVRWEKEPENADQVLLTYPGYQRDSFLLDADCPRFSSGEGKAVLRQSVRGYDLYILCDVTNYSNTYRMYGMEVPMSPDDYFQDLKRIIAAEGANVMVVHHDRTDVDLDIRDAILEITMETQDREHAQRVIDALRANGFKVS